MIDPHNPTLGQKAPLWAGPSVERTATLGREERDQLSFAVGGAGIDRNALMRYLAILLPLFVAYLVAAPSTMESEWGLVNAVCPIILCLSSLWTGFKVAVSNPQAIWTPVPWFTLVVALYYGFGPLLYVFGDVEIVDSMNRFWPVGPYELGRTNLLNTVCIMVIVAAYLIWDKLFASWQDIDRTSSPSSASKDDSARTAAFVFLCIGLPVRYLLVLPAHLGQYLGRDATMPGIIKGLNTLVYLSVFMLAYLGSRRKGLWKHGFWLLFVMEIMSNATTLMKADILLVFIMAALGRFQAKRSAKELVFFGMATLALYALVVKPVVTWSRAQIGEGNYTEYRGSFSGHLFVIGQGTLILLTEGELKTESMAKQEWWARLCYPNAQTACMHFYDVGSSGDSFMYAVYSWIPRLIWPDKPILNLGQQFTILVQGSDHNSTGAGIFGESYWNGGWLMVVLASAYVGFIFALFSRMAFRILAHSEWLFLPCLFMGITMGLRIDRWFAPNYVTSALMALAYYVIIRFALSLGRNHG